MVIVSALKHNRFRNVDIPSGADLFSRVGPREAPTGNYSGEVYINPSVSKIEAAQDVIENDSELVK